MTTIIKTLNIYLLDVDTIDGVNHIKLNGIQLLRLSDAVNRHIKTEDV